MTSDQIDKAIHDKHTAIISYQKLFSVTVDDVTAMPAMEFHIKLIERLEKIAKECGDTLIQLRMLRLERYFAAGLLKEAASND